MNNMNNQSSNSNMNNQSSNSNSSRNSSSNRLNVPEARQAMDQFKMQAADDEDVSTTY